VLTPAGESGTSTAVSVAAEVVASDVASSAGAQPLRAAMVTAANDAAAIFERVERINLSIRFEREGSRMEKLSFKNKPLSILSKTDDEL
jgi:hypothetical protein